MFFCYDILTKPLDAPFDMEPPLPLPDGDFKNLKVRKKKKSPTLNTSIPRIFVIETTSCEASKEY